METVICLDTGVVIDILRKKDTAVRWLTKIKIEQSVAITLISLFELYRGAYLGSRMTEEVAAVDSLKTQLTVLPLTEQHMQEAARESVALEKLGRSLDIRDLLIGVCARQEGCLLKTYNRKHFAFLRGLQLAE